MAEEAAKTILLVEDEPDILEMIRYNLERAGFAVLAAEDGEKGLELARARLPDLIILDLMLPRMDGLDVCKSLRGDVPTREIPILMLTAKKDDVDRVVGLELGADDYVVKPFVPRELVLRVRAILRRSSGTSTGSAAEEMRFGPLRISRPAHQAWLGGEPLTLTATEFGLLVTLMDRRGRVQTRDELLNTVWGYDHVGYGRTVDTHIRRLREKLGRHDWMIETVRGVGYRFCPEAP